MLGVADDEDGDETRDDGSAADDNDVGTGIDADLTLEAGRLFLSAPKATRPMVVRLRMNREIWDLTLADATTEVAIDLIGEPAKVALFEAVAAERPRAIVYLQVLRGNANLRYLETVADDLTAGARYKWDSKAGKPGPAPKADPDEPALLVDRWSREDRKTPGATVARQAATELLAVIGKVEDDLRNIVVNLKNEMNDRMASLPSRSQAAWMLQAIDGPKSLLGVIGAETSSAPKELRDTIVRALQHWAAVSDDRQPDLNVAIRENPAFDRMHLADLEAMLLGRADAADEKAVTKLFTLLGSEKLAIRETARLSLTLLNEPLATRIAYDAGAAAGARNTKARAWQTDWGRKK